MKEVSVKVMLSYDYCHFEVCLSAECPTTFDANELRKDAQRLADEAVRQYKTSKEYAQKRLSLESENARLLDEIRRFKEIVPESEYSAEQKAKIKAIADKEHWERFDYNYEDDDEYGF